MHWQEPQWNFERSLIVIFNQMYHMQALLVSTKSCLKFLLHTYQSFVFDFRNSLISYLFLIDFTIAMDVYYDVLEIKRRIRELTVSGVETRTFIFRHDGLNHVIYAGCFTIAHFVQEYGSKILTLISTNLSFCTAAAH